MSLQNCQDFDHFRGDDIICFLNNEKCEKLVLFLIILRTRDFFLKHSMYYICSIGITLFLKFHTLHGFWRKPGSAAGPVIDHSPQPLNSRNRISLPTKHISHRGNTSLQFHSQGFSAVEGEVMLHCDSVLLVWQSHFF